MMTRQPYSSALVAGRAWLAGDSSSAVSWPAALAKSLARPIARMQSRRRTRRAIEELMALDNRMLADIGISRGEIEYAASFGRLPGRSGDGRRQIGPRGRPE